MIGQSRRRWEGVGGITYRGADGAVQDLHCNLFWVGLLPLS